MDKFVKKHTLKLQHIFLFLALQLPFLAVGQYCVPQGDCSNGAFIDDFSIGQISNLSSGGSNCNTTSYDNTGLTTVLFQGEDHGFTLKGNSGVFQTFAIWIDLNNDSIFSAQEMVYSSNFFSSGNPISDSLSIPSTATIGPTKMRVRSNTFLFFNGFESCSTFLDGEIEDYVVDIQPNTNPPLGEFSTANPTSCSGTFAFKDETLLNPTHWLWDFGDGTTDTVQNPTHTYQNPGSYTVSLIVTNSFGSDSVTKSNYINFLTPPAIKPAPCAVTKTSSFAGFGITQFTFGPISQASADAATEGAYVEYLCDPDTLVAGTSYSLSIICDQPATHNVRVWLDLNDDGAFSNSSELLYSADNVLTPSGNITIPGAITTNKVLRLRVMADDNFSWAGNNACDVLTYGQAEDYAVFIKPSTSPPVAGFSIDPNLSCDGTVQFTDNSLNVPTSWLWDFGDGTTSTQPSPQHTYQNSGVYSVTLTVTNTNGTDDETKVNSVTVQKNKQLKPACTPGSGQQLQGYGIFQFSLSSINNTSGGSEEGYQDYSCVHNATVTNGTSYNVNITTSSTNFEDVKIFIDYNNDGSFSSNEEVFYSQSSNTHSGTIFISPNAVTDTYLRLRVYADGVGQIGGGCGTSQFSQIEDYGLQILQNPNLPQADFSASAQQSCSKTISFSEQTSGQVTQYRWDFGDGTSSTQVNPTHTYNNPGEYDVTLIATNAIWSDTLTKQAFIDIDYGFCDSTNMSTGASTTLTTCFGSLFDSGGPTGNYQAGNEAIITLSPVAATQVSLRFLSFDLLPGDHLRIFDGADTTGTLLGSFSGNTIPAAIQSSSGSITLKEETTSGNTAVGYHVVWNCLTPFSTPIAEFTVDSTESCSGIIQFADQSANSPTSWFWDFGDGNTATDSAVTHQYLSPGIYDVKLVVNNPSGSDSLTKSEFIEVNDDFCSTGIVSLHNNNAITSYPNPTKGFFYLEHPYPLVPQKLEVVSITGEHQSVTFHSGETKTTLDLQRLSPGIYVVRYRDETRSFSRRIVKLSNE